MTPSTQASGEPNYILTICLRVSPRTKRMKLAPDISRNMTVNLVELLEELEPVLKKYKIHASVSAVTPRPTVN